MATDAVQICNKALLRIGHRQLIGDLGENTAEAQACNTLYPLSRDEVLAELPWRFASYRSVLALLTTTRNGWAFAYSLPADCVAPRRLWDGLRNPGKGQRIPFDVEGDATSGGILLTDQPAAELIYTALIEDVPRFPPLFVDALAWKLAADLALGVTVKPQVGMAMAQQYTRALARAAASDANQGQADVPPDAEHIRAR